MKPVPITVKEHEGFIVVRDDLVPGGTKARLAPLLFDGVEECVYASPVYGYAQIALAHAARSLGKRATILCAERTFRHPRTQEAIFAGANVIEVPCGYLTVVQARARAYVATRPDARLVPFGFDSPEIIAALADVARKVPVKPKEVWSVAGSGVLTRALQVAWPKAAFFAVQVGSVPDAGSATVLRSDLKFEKEAPEYARPPFPSCTNYDAKAWPFVKAYASKGALVWNVAS